MLGFVLGKREAGVRMASTHTLRDGIVIGLFVLAQFFWLFASFAYSETDRDRRLQERESKGEAVTLFATERVAPQDPARPNSPQSPATPAALVSEPNDPSSPSTTSKPTTPGADLGSQIKYCIVFPILNSAGEPIPTFDVPSCDGTPPPPPPPGSPKFTVVKVVINDDNGTATTTDFTLLVGSTTVSSGAKRTYPAGTYTVSESTTTVTIGTSTMKYVADFSGDCDSSGGVTLVAGDDKICTLTNDDEGPGGRGGEGPGNGGNGGEPGGNGGGPGGNGGGPGSAGGGPGSTSGGSSGGSSSGGSGSLYPGGQIAGTVTPPDYVGGYTPEPGPPNAGSGGTMPETFALLLFSAEAALLGSFLSLALQQNRRGKASTVPAVQ